MNFEWHILLDHLLHLAIAYALAAPIGWDREVSTRSAGLRTYPLVAIGACSFLLVGDSFLANDESKSRLIEGLMGGLGFIGGGAILKRNDEISGMATAASIWITGAIGMSVALRYYEIAVILSLFSFMTLHYGNRVKSVLGSDENQSEK